MARENTRQCLACGGLVFRPRKSDQLYCASPSCVFSQRPLPEGAFDLIESLLADRYRAGYQSAVDDMSSQLTVLEGKAHEHRRSDRSNPHAD